MPKRLVGNVRRWSKRVSVASLQPIYDITNHEFFEPISSFKLDFKHSVPLQGFYMLEVNSLKPFSRSLSALYYSVGQSKFDAKDSFFLPLGSRKTVKRVVYFSGYTKHLKWGVNGAIDADNISKFKLSKISSRFTKTMLIKKLVANGCIESDIKGLNLSDLYSKYDAIFSAKNRRVIDYRGWMNEVEAFSAPIINESVKFSVIMPVYNPNIEFLSEAIESVISQTYSNWELCISDDCSSLSSVRELILRYAAKDNRIKYIFRDNNGNISLASNSALEIATGQYIALLDHDDVLSPYALNEVALVLASGSADVVYSDEDKIDAHGKRYEPHFKSDFNYELILSHNYISHLGVYKKILVDAVGGFRLGYEGSQDYDLLLRCMVMVGYSNIKHIPKILYHWRAIEGSTAQDASQKSYTSLAGLKALKDAVSLINSNWKVDKTVLPNTYKVSRPVDNEPFVSIIIPTKDQKKLLKSCIDSILSKTAYLNYEIVVVDNGSVQQETLQYFLELAATKNIRILEYKKPFNFSAINNYAVSHCDKSDFVLLLNNDVEVINDTWLTEMVSIAQQKSVGCVGAKLYYSNGLIQHAGVILGIGGVAGHSHKYSFRQDNGYFNRLQLRQDLSAVTAACLLVKRSVYLKVSGLNDKNLSIAFNDVDFCLKVRELGLRNVWTPFSELYHHESISRGAEDTPDKIARFNKEVNYMKETWGDILLADQYYNENLTLEHENFTFKAVK